MTGSRRAVTFDGADLTARAANPKRHFLVPRVILHELAHAVGLGQARLQLLGRGPCRPRL
jgi:hypothetical protein